MESVQGLFFWHRISFYIIESPLSKINRKYKKSVIRGIVKLERQNNITRGITDMNKYNRTRTITILD